MKKIKVKVLPKLQQAVIKKMLIRRPQNAVYEAPPNNFVKHNAFIMELPKPQLSQKVYIPPKVVIKPQPHIAPSQIRFPNPAPPQEVIQQVPLWKQKAYLSNIYRSDY